MAYFKIRLDSSCESCWTSLRVYLKFNRILLNRYQKVPWNLWPQIFKIIIIVFFYDCCHSFLLLFDELLLMKNISGPSLGNFVKHHRIFPFSLQFFFTGSIIHCTITNQINPITIKLSILNRISFSPWLLRCWRGSEKTDRFEAELHFRY